MKAEEVRRRYAAGERNFQNANLRGQNFKGQDLSGADFSNADIRSANFSQANLTGANFTGAKAGLQKRWVILQLLIAIPLSAAMDFVAVIFPATFTAGFLTPSSIEEFTIFPGLLSLFTIAVVFFAIARQGCTTRALMTIALAVTLAGALALAVTLAVAGAGAGPVAVAAAVALALAVTLAVALAGAAALAAALAGTGAGAGPVAGAVTAGAVALAVTGAVTAGAVAVAVALALAILLLSFYVAWRALKGDEKFALVRTFSVAFGALGGTLFYQADLTRANFSNATLKSTNFREADLTHVCWKEAQKLDRSRVGDSILASPAVRDLLISRMGYKKSYVNANFRGANLAGVNLNQANLQWAVLSEAVLRRADLREANLREVLALDTDFTGASFTGACIEAWNIDATTKLESIDCQHVYLLRNQQERRPSSGNFAPEEFTKLFEEALSTVDLIFRNGVDWKAFIAAFTQVQVENEDTELTIQSIENKGDGVVVVRVNVPPETDKTKIHSEFNQNYEAALKALEAKYQTELKAKDTEITIYREQSANMWTTINSLASRPINLVNENTLMNNSTDRSQNINVGRDMNLTGSTLNLGEINGQVTNTINQLPDEPATTDQPSLKDLLTQLQQSITADTDLAETDKADLLEQVQALATAKQTEEPAQKEGIVRKSKKMFEATLKSLPDTAKIVEACSKLLPLILKALGIPA